MRFTKSHLYASVIFGLALMVRLLGLTWGLPNATRWYSYHPDESTNQIVGAVVHLLQGDFNPHFFNYPSLTIYATWLIYQLMALLGLTTNAVAPSYPWPIVRDIILAGRLFSVACGTLTAPLIFLIARRLQDGKWAVLAGVLTALAPGHVQHSHFATTDVPATFFVVCCVYVTLRATNPRGLLWAALVAGLAAGTKYNAGLVLIAPLLRAFWFSRAQGDEQTPKVAFWTLVPLQIALAAFGFLLTTPFALLAPHDFWGDTNGNGFYFEAFVHPKIGSGDIFQNTGNGWIYHFTFNLPFVLTWPLIIGTLVGIYFVAKKPLWWPMLAFLGLFFFTLGLSQVRFMRYVLPLAPFLCLLAAFGASRLRFPRVWGGVLAGFALIGCSNVLWPLNQTDPRDRNPEVGQRILQQHGRLGLVGNPWFYTPPFQPQGFNTPVANIDITGLDPAKVRALRRVGAESAFSISEYEWRETVRLSPEGRMARFLKDLDNLNVKKLIYKNQVPLALPGRDFAPHDYLYTNPETRIYWFGVG